MQTLRQELAKRTNRLLALRLGTVEGDQAQMGPAHARGLAAGQRKEEPVHEGHHQKRSAEDRKSQAAHVEFATEQDRTPAETDRSRINTMLASKPAATARWSVVATGASQ